MINEGCEMNKLIEELYDLLKKHNAAIVRSADENNKLVICKYINGIELSVEFEEEITPPFGFSDEND